MITTSEEANMKVAVGFLVLVQLIFSVLAQESINVHDGYNVGMHAGIALAMCFGILGSCAVGVNLLKKCCAKHIRQG